MRCDGDEPHLQHPDDFGKIKINLVKIRSQVEIYEIYEMYTYARMAGMAA